MCAVVRRFDARGVAWPWGVLRLRIRKYRNEFPAPIGAAVGMRSEGTGDRDWMEERAARSEE
jgi:hypothetical protein